MHNVCTKINGSQMVLCLVHVYIIRFGCFYTCMFLYIHNQIRVYIILYILCFYVYMSIHVYTSIYIYIYIYIYVYIYVYMFIHIRVYIYIYIVKCLRYGLRQRNENRTFEFQLPEGRKN